MRTSINDIFIVSLRYFPECPIYRHHYNAKISKREPLFAFFFYHDGNCLFLVGDFHRFVGSSVLSVQGPGNLLRSFQLQLVGLEGLDKLRIQLTGHQTRDNLLKLNDIGRLVNQEIILAGRRMNDSMGEYVATETVKLMLKKGIQVLDSEILIVGFTFKENCPDVRNTKVVDIYKALAEYNLHITVYDPWVNSEVARSEYGIDVLNELPSKKYDAVIMAVAHDVFNMLSIQSLVKELAVVYDVKWILERTEVDGRL